MGKLIAILLVVIGVSLLGCGSGPTDEELAESADAQTETVEAMPTATILPTLTPLPSPEPTATIRPTITPLPFVEGTEFPTGTFEQVGSHAVVEFREDGTARWYSQRQLWEIFSKYGVNGNLFTEMTFGGIIDRQVPGTYFWTYDGNFLSFQLRGVDPSSFRKGFIDGQTYKFVLEAEALSQSNKVEFPIGRFIDEGGARAFDFDDDGTWRFFEDNLEQPAYSGRYVTNESLYTETTHDDPEYSQFPATYIWTYDGQRLTFELWGEDPNDRRKGVYDGQTYIKTE